MGLVGIDRLRRAAEILRRDGTGAATPLFEAASDVEAALLGQDSWPAGLRIEAASLRASLFRYGSIRTTVTQMVGPERLQLRREILAFSDLAERDGERVRRGIE